MASAEYSWQKERRKPEFASGANLEPVGKYGPAGSHTLWLPSSKVSRKRVFRDGVPQIVPVSAMLDDTELMQMRHDVLKKCRTINDPIPILLADLILLEYSAALVRRVYSVTDEDLEFIHSGNGWMEPIFIHAMGGMEARDNWRRAASLPPFAIAAVADSDSATGLAAPTFATDLVEPTPETSEGFDLSSD